MVCFVKNRYCHATVDKAVSNYYQFLIRITILTTEIDMQSCYYYQAILIFGLVNNLENTNR